MKTLIIISIMWMLPNNEIKTNEITLNNNCKQIVSEFEAFGKHMIEEGLFLTYEVKCEKEGQAI